MAGGRGTRFWPKSRERMPKHLLDIAGERTLIQETVTRIETLVPAENILIVTGLSHAGELMKQLPNIPPENVLIEPVGRNTAPCIGLAALHVKRKHPEEVMAVLPADHIITDAREFCEVLSIAAEVARQGNYLVTIGIPPTRPEVGYGYIERGTLKISVRGRDVHEVASIREKPPLETAKTFLKQGGFYWNSGMFVWRVDAILRAMEKFLPALHQSMIGIEEAMGTDREQEIIDREYAHIEPISIDYGVMEKAKNVLLIRGDFGWSDVGSWDALWEISGRDEDGNAASTCGHFVGVDAKDSLVHSTGKMVALIGVKDLIVVETEDSLLICKRGRSQDVKKVVDILEKKNMKEFL
jgi:mannose-1-phosphate guanylyltransferase